MPSLENPDFLHLPAPVEALFRRAAERSFFALPIWYHVLSRYGTDKASSSRLYLDDETAPKAALVCAEARRSRAALTGFRPITAPNMGRSTRPASRASWLPWRASRPRSLPRPRACHALQLAGLDPQDAGYAALIESFAGAGWAVFPYFDSATWYEDTRGLDFPRYLAERPAALRNTWRRRSAKLDASGAASVIFHEDTKEIESGVADYTAVCRASWQGTEPYPDFMPALMRAAAEAGALRLGIMRLDGAPIAAQMWIVWRSRATIYKLAHDRHFDDLSVGTVLTMRMMERVLGRDRPDEIDFGRGDDAYKKLWLTKRRERWGLFIANPRTLRGLALTLRERAAVSFRHWRGKVGTG